VLKHAAGNTAVICKLPPRHIQTLQVIFYQDHRSEANSWRCHFGSRPSWATVREPNDFGRDISCHRYKEMYRLFHILLLPLTFSILSKAASAERYRSKPILNEDLFLTFWLGHSGEHLSSSTSEAELVSPGNLSHSMNTFLT
jgi:hypothetical protein